MCNEVDRERDPQQQVFFQTLKPSHASRPTSAKPHADAADYSATPRGVDSSFKLVPALAVESISSDTTT